VKDNDPQALAMAIKRFAQNKELCKKLGENAKKSIDERFNWDNIVSKLIRLYEADN
jgi:glycosyltransferase involved in cell wall biosynthesis